MRSMQISDERLKRSREVMVSVEARRYYELRRNVGSCGDGGSWLCFMKGDLDWIEEEIRSEGKEWKKRCGFGGSAEAWRYELQRNEVSGGLESAAPGKEVLFKGRRTRTRASCSED